MKLLLATMLLCSLALPVHGKQSTDPAPDLKHDEAKPEEECVRPEIEREWLAQRKLTAKELSGGELLAFNEAFKKKYHLTPRPDLNLLMLVETGSRFQLFAFKNNCLEINVPVPADDARELLKNSGTW